MTALGDKVTTPQVADRVPLGSNPFPPSQAFLLMSVTNTKIVPSHIGCW
jgi:hypothetical protein